MQQQRTLAIILFCLFLGQALYLLSAHSQVHDEPLHTVSGVLYLQNGQFSGGTFNPPFLQTLFGLPYALNLSHYELTGDIPPYAGRLVNVILGLMLVLVASWWSYKISGPWGGLLTLTLFATSPSFIAHSSITTTDMGVSTFIILAVFTYWQGHEKRSRFLIILSGAFFGLAVAGKFTALALIPVALWLELSTTQKRRASWGRALLNLVLVAFAVWLFFCVTYGFQGCFTVKKLTKELRVPIPPTLAWISPTLAVHGIEQKLSQMSGGDSIHYYLGVYEEMGYWYYYPTIIFLKTPPGTLILAAFLLLLFVSGKLKLDYRASYIILPGLWVYCSFLINQAQGGVRHLFPSYAFLFIILGTLTEARLPQNLRRAIISLALIINLGAIALSFPFHMSYFNFLAPLVTNAHFYCGGPDTDNAQDENFLRQKLDTLPKEMPIYICPQPPERPRVGYIAINCDTYTYWMPKGDRRAYDWLYQFKPERIGGAWLLYHVEERQLRNKALSVGASFEHIRPWLEYLIWEGRYEEVLLFGRKLVDVHPIVHLAIAKTLIMQEKFEEALAEVETCQKAPLRQLCLYLCGKGTESSTEQRAKALLGLFTLNEKLTYGLRRKLEEKYGFAGPISANHPCHPLRAYKGATYFRKQQFEKAHLMFKDIYDDKKLPSYIRAFHIETSKYDSWAKSNNFTLRLGLAMRQGYAKNDPHGALARIRALIAEAPENYRVNIALHRLNGLQRRGVICLDLGRKSIWDKIDPKTYQYERGTK